MTLYWLFFIFAFAVYAVNSDTVPLKDDVLIRLNELENKLDKLQQHINILENTISEMKQCQPNNDQEMNDIFAGDPFDINTIQIKFEDKNEIILQQFSDENTEHCPKWKSTNNNDNKASLFCEHIDNTEQYHWILEINEYSFYDVITKNILNTHHKWKLMSTKHSKYQPPKHVKDEVIHIKLMQTKPDVGGLLLYFLEESYYEIIEFENFQTGMMKMKNVIPKYSKAIHADVYIIINPDSNGSKGDHFIFQIGSKLCPNKKESCSGWNYGAAKFNRTYTPKFKPKQVFLYHPGQHDNFKSYYGTWYTSLTIPLTDNQNIVWSNPGCNIGTYGTVVIRISGYYAAL